MTNTLIFFFKKESHLKNVFILKIGLHSVVDFFPQTLIRFILIWEKISFGGMKCKISVFLKISLNRVLKTINGK